MKMRPPAAVRTMHATKIRMIFIRHSPSDGLKTRAVPPPRFPIALRLKRHLDTQLEGPRVWYCGRRVGRDDVLQVGLRCQPGVDLNQVRELYRLFGVRDRYALHALGAHIVRPVARIGEREPELVCGAAFE